MPPRKIKKFIKCKLIQPGLPIFACRVMSYPSSFSEKNPTPQDSKARFAIFCMISHAIPLFQVLSVPEHLEKITFPRKLSTLAKTARFFSFCCRTLNFYRTELVLLSLESSSIELSIDHTTSSGTLLFRPLELAEAIYKYCI